MGWKIHEPTPKQIAARVREIQETDAFQSRHSKLLTPEPWTVPVILIEDCHVDRTEPDDE